jgi:hypothetical protein
MNNPEAELTLDAAEINVVTNRTSDGNDGEQTAG